MLTLFFFLPLLVLATIIHLVAGIFRFRRHRRYGWGKRYTTGFSSPYGRRRGGFLLPLLAFLALERLFSPRRYY